jgi:hypothetical protein
MFQLVAMAVYGTSLILSLGLLYYFGSKAWYWHALSVMVAVAIGLAPTPEALWGKVYDLTVGFVFTFLLLWGVLPLAPFLRAPHYRHRNAH